MRVASMLAILVLLAGCVQGPAAPDAEDGAKPHRTSSPYPGDGGVADGSVTPTPTPSQSSTGTHCGMTTTARWIEPGVFARADAHPDFHERPAAEGRVVSDANMTARYGPVNVTSLGPAGEPGTQAIQGLILRFPAQEFRGYTADDADVESVREEFLAFAGWVLQRNESALQEHAEAFLEARNAHGGHRLVVLGPFKAASFATRVWGHGVESWSGVSSVHVASDAGWVRLTLETHVGHALEVNRLDWVQHSAPGDLSAAWASANATFDALGWPRPDLSQARTSYYVC